MSDVHIHIHHPAACDPRAHDAILHFLAAIKEKQTTMSEELNTRLAALDSTLAEGLTEISADLTALRGQITLTAEGEATLQRIEARAAALANLSPAVPAEPSTGEPA